MPDGRRMCPVFSCPITWIGRPSFLAYSRKPRISGTNFEYWPRRVSGPSLMYSVSLTSAWSRHPQHSRIGVNSIRCSITSMYADATESGAASSPMSR